MRGKASEAVWTWKHEKEKAGPLSLYTCPALTTQSSIELSSSATPNPAWVLGMPSSLCIPFVHFVLASSEEAPWLAEGFCLRLQVLQCNDFTWQFSDSLCLHVLQKDDWTDTSGNVFLNHFFNKRHNSLQQVMFVRHSFRVFSATCEKLINGFPCLLLTWMPGLMDLGWRVFLLEHFLWWQTNHCSWRGVRGTSLLFKMPL